MVRSPPAGCRVVIGLVDIGDRPSILLILASKAQFRTSYVDNKTLTANSPDVVRVWCNVRVTLWWLKIALRVEYEALIGGLMSHVYFSVFRRIMHCLETFNSRKRYLDNITSFHVKLTYFSQQCCKLPFRGWLFFSINSSYLTSSEGHAAILNNGNRWYIC